ncbi:MAG: hypothetical protein K2I00_02980 [Ruminococcus sp.]|nr:hypothetical protein [Ruminococcus sp.]
MSYFLIDYENAGAEGLNGLTKLTENDNLILFYSEIKSTMTFTLHRTLNESRVAIKYCNIDSDTENALDFLLSSYLGYLIGKSPELQNEQFYIISQNKRFDILRKCWSTKVPVSIIPQICMADLKETSKNSPENKEKTDEKIKPKETKENFTIMQMLSSVSGISEYIPQIMNIINTYRTKEKLNAELTKLECVHIKMASKIIARETTEE